MKDPIVGVKEGQIGMIAVMTVTGGVLDPS